MSDFDLLLKLFDTLKDSSKDTQDLCHAMLTNQNNIGSYIKNLPVDELRNALKEHNKESADNIDACTETVETKTDAILKIVDLIETKIGKMITVVIVAFALLTVAFIIGRLSMDTSSLEKKIESTQQEEHQVIIDAVKDSMEKEFEKVRKEMDKFHKEK
jgi:hypothetical protein